MNSRRYRDVKAAILKCLETGNYQHETRSGRANEKNLLQVNLVSEAFVMAAIKSFPAGRAKRSNHHFLSGVDVWTLDPVIDEGAGIVRMWYLKFYCLANDDAWFISVHPSEPQECVPPEAPHE